MPLGTSDFARDTLMARTRSNVDGPRPGRTVHGHAGEFACQGHTPAFASETRQPGLDLRAEEPASTGSIPAPAVDCAAATGRRAVGFELVGRFIAEG